MKRLIVILIMFCLLQSCIIGNGTISYDNGKEIPRSNVCELHEVKMKKRIVGTQYGKLMISPIKVYPHSRGRLPMGCRVPPWPKKRLMKIYVCSNCNKAERENKKKKPS